MNLVVYSMLGLAGLSKAIPQWPLDFNECVDPSGMKQCDKEVTDNVNTCINAPDYDPEADGFQDECYCTQTKEWIDCMGRHCWDSVYTCEYQQLALISQAYCKDAPDLMEIPFLPPPEDAPAACSCNMLEAFLLADQAGNDQIACFEDSENASDRMTACDCCGLSGRLSAVINTCPDNAVELLGITKNRTFEFEGHYDLLYGDFLDQECGSLMDDFSCDSDLGFSLPGNGSDVKFYKPDELPTEGQSVSNGDETITAPVSGATYTWTWNDETRTVTAVSAEGSSTGRPAEDEDEDEDEDGNDDDDAEETGDDENDDGDDAEETGDDESAAVATVVPYLLSALLGAFALV